MTITTSALGGQGESDHAWRGAPQLLRGYRFRPRAGKFAFCQSAAHMMMGANAQHLDCNGQATPRDRGAAHWSTPNFAPNWNAAAGCLIFLKLFAGLRFPATTPFLGKSVRGSTASTSVSPPPSTSSLGPAGLYHPRPTRTKFPLVPHNGLTIACRDFWAIS